MEPTASWVENDFESRPVEHLKDIIDNEFQCLPSGHIMLNQC
jgi:hypothetical protein